jgi:hypothetical protein
VTRPVCPDCGHIHTSTDTIAVGRLHPPASALVRYRANHPGAPLRYTREAAEADMCRWRKEQK